jgi:hypothetical protein
LADLKPFVELKLFQKLKVLRTSKCFCFRRSPP